MIKVIMVIMACGGDVCQPALFVYGVQADLCLAIKKAVPTTPIYCIPMGRQV